MAESKLTPAVSKAVLSAVAVGLPLKFAALKAGIGERTLYRWLRAGKAAGSGPERQFWQNLKKAQAASIEVRVKRLGKAATKGAWQADCWWLERMFPGQFASDRREIAALLRRVAELENQLRGTGGDDSPPGPASGAAEGGAPAGQA